MQQPAQQQLIVVREAKSVGLAYVLWFFLGGLGIHRFYLDRVGSGVGMLALGLVGWSTIFIFFIGLLPLTVLGIWLLVDLFLIPDMVREENQTRSVPVGYIAVPQTVINYEYGLGEHTVGASAAEIKLVRLASVSEVVDLSIAEALNSAQLLLTRQGYEVVTRTESSIKARQLQQYFQTTPSRPPSIVEVLAHPQVGGGVRIDLMGQVSDIFFKEHQSEWSAWADTLPKRKSLPAIVEGDIST